MEDGRINLHVIYQSVPFTAAIQFDNRQILHDPAVYAHPMDGSLEITLSRNLVRLPSGMGGGSVSVASSLLSPPFVVLGIVLHGSDLNGREGERGDGSDLDSDFMFLPLHTPFAFPNGRAH